MNTSNNPTHLSPDSLRKKKEDVRPTEAYMQFTNYLSAGKTGFFAFVEGPEDPPYYQSALWSVYHREKFNSIICGNRDKVIQTLHSILNKHDNQKFLQSWCGFFVDKDFQLVPEITTTASVYLYITPCYAIENFYTQSTTIENILETTFKIYSLHRDFEAALQLYTDYQSQFHEAITPLNVWYACIAESNQPLNFKDENQKSKFNEIKKKNIITNKNIFEKCCIDKGIEKADYICLTNYLNEIVEIPPEKLEKKSEEFEKIQDKGRFFRGKFELYFILWFLNRIIEDSNNSKKIIKEHKISYSIKDGNFIADFANFAEIPDCLKDFFKKRKEAIDSII